MDLKTANRARIKARKGPCDLTVPSEQRLPYVACRETNGRTRRTATIKAALHRERIPPGLPQKIAHPFDDRPTAEPPVF